MIEEVKKQILKSVKLSDYQKGLDYYEEYVRYVMGTNVGYAIRHQFLVESESTYKKYIVQVSVNNNEITDTFCTCPRFAENGSCKHVAASCIIYSEKLFKIMDEKRIKEKSLTLLNRLKSNHEDVSLVKQQVSLVPYLSIEKSYYGYNVGLHIKIGVKKMYALLNKFSSFWNAYMSRTTYSFGKDFVFDSRKHYFSEKGKELLEYINLMRRYYQTMNNTLYVDDMMLKKIFEMYENGLYLKENEQLLVIKNGFPISFKFHKKDGIYTLENNTNTDELIILTDDCEYIFYNNTIYKLNEEQQLLIKEMKNQNIKQIVFEEKEFNDFQKNVLGTIKSNLELDDTTKDIVIDITPDVKLYFDLEEDHITCNINFSYKEIEVSYFDEVSTLIRDADYENKIVSEICSYGFLNTNKIFIMDDFDECCDFMDEKIDELAKKYNVYTSEKIKNTSFIRNNSIKATFGIGQDNILHFDFDLGSISNDEIDKVLLSYKNKKKYYKLKSGDILSLEDSSLQQLEELTQELELSNKDLKQTNGIIPKYRALYLDSIKDKKYGIVRTNSLFQDFIKQFNEFQNEDVKFTKEELNILRPYQVDGVKWLYTISKCGFGGILADEMGLGKSIQTITFIKKILKSNSDARFLIVTPTGLMYNWEKEIQKFAPKLSYSVFAENRKFRRDKLEKFDGSIYITSYNLLREDLEIYNDISFEVFAIDEAQNIKNPKAGLTEAVKSINATTKIALTGTPIENSIVELWSIFDFLMPGFLSSLVKFQQKYKVKDFDDETNKLLGRLKEQVKPFILRRKKKDVVKDLPDKIENNIYIDLNEEQKIIYAAEVKRVKEEMDAMIKDGGFTKNKMMILSLLTRLRQICIDPSIILKGYKEESSKMEELIKVIKESTENGHKILLFTSFKTALMKVKDKLDDENISNYVITGDTKAKQRQELVDAFNKDDTKVFLIMLKSGGTGLNLTSADVVIHLDLWWNPQAENQATDRTHRIGQTKTVEVIKLICKGTIEEKILELQEKKKVLSDKILESGMDDASYFRQLNEEDVRSLLAYENKDE